MLSNAQLIKETGATFTPVKLADFISDGILSYISTCNQTLKVLDPACGEGALLSSISGKLIKKNISFELLGFDSNANFLEIAKDNLNQIKATHKVSLQQNDFLKQIKPDNKQRSLFEHPIEHQFINSKIDIIIANPPYVRTQTLGAKYAQEISEKFNLKGRVDLYYPFLIGMAYALKEGGLLGVVTSNRYLSTKSGISVRQFIEDNFDILEVIDLGDTKLFDAAVLPAILFARKKTNPNKACHGINKQANFIKVYETTALPESSAIQASSLYNVLSHKGDGTFITPYKAYKKTSGKIKFLNTKDHSWSLLSNSEANWVDKINQSASHLIGDLFKVRIGIKTTADKIFIKHNWEDEIHTPEEAILRQLISQENIETWETSNEKTLKVLYPHVSVNNKKETINLDQFPNTKKYLLEHKDKLSSRKYLIEAGRKWFEIWVPHNPELWNLPKLVFPDISSHPRFCFDESKSIVNGNCYWIVAKNPNEIDYLLLIQGVANSSIMNQYHDLMFNNKLYSGRKRYFSQYVEKYPLPDLASKFSQDIIAIVKKLNSFPSNKEVKQELIQMLDVAVAKAFGINAHPV